MTDAHQHPEAPPRLSVESEAEIRETLDGYIGCPVDQCDSCVRYILLAELDAVRIDRDQWRARAEALRSMIVDSASVCTLTGCEHCKWLGFNLGRYESLEALAAPASSPDWHKLPSVNLLTGMLPRDQEPAPAAAPQDDSPKEWWHASVKAVRSSLELREILLRSVMSSMDLAGLPADRTRSEALLEQALAGPPLIYPGTDQEPAGEGSRQDE